ncbi:cytochrome c [Pseudomonas chlororaphis]|uniref:cytochrome c n=1 Tax=Pseudomonas chlororaphis TaxID=587753 RepID=UPI00236701BF|nr:cytochrome c [Pseudomonas chlororaphis]WDH20850.1 cytochrome c [Pseudomonas chlororaphis]
MSKFKSIAGWSLTALSLVATAGAFLSWQPAIAPLDNHDTQYFSHEQVARGEQLAAVGDCAVCHTAPGGARNAGGLAMRIPFGTLYSTNITPDPETGIGSWSYPAFERAMRHGIDRSGRYLYPAFPYTAFTKTRDEDLKALYAYLMSQPPVRHQPPPTDLHFPFNIRPGILAWNWLYLRPGAMANDPGRSAQWNRGAYLSEGLGHCSACHSPRDPLFGERGGRRHLSGGVAEDWSAHALVGGNAPLAWTEQDLLDFLRHGYSPRHGVAAGPMAPVIHEGLAQLPDADLQAIAHYLSSLQPASTPQASATTLNHQAEQRTEPLSSPGARLFSGACMACHAQEKGPTLTGVRPSLALNSNLYADSPDNAIRVILEGIAQPANPALGYMPAFRYSLDDQQIADLLRFLRQDLAGQAPWKDVKQRVSQIRASLPPG